MTSSKFSSYIFLLLAQSFVVNGEQRLMFTPVPGTGLTPVSLPWDVRFRGEWQHQYNNNNNPPPLPTSNRYRGVASMTDGMRGTRQTLGYMNDCERSLQTRHRLENRVPANLMLGMSFITFVGSLATGNFPFAAWVFGLTVVAYQAAAAVGVAAAGIAAVPLAQTSVCYVQQLLM